MIKIEKLNPFGRMCISLGMLPSSYKESLTYEEQLLWFFKYLDETVIPTINNNAQAVEELQALYLELKSYVDSYFDNLDVQEEINNKLDDMAESGQLTDIIAQYLQLAGVLAYNTVSDMKEAENLVDGSICKTLGYNTINDNGGSYYKIRTITNEDIVDEASIIALSDNSLIAQLIVLNNTLQAEQFGAIGDNETDDIQALQKCINYANTYNYKVEMNKNYLISDTLNLYSNLNIKINLLNYTGLNEAIKLDGISYVNLQINEIHSTQDGISLKASSALNNNNKIDLNYCYCERNAISLIATAGIAYNKISFNNISPGNYGIYAYSDRATHSSAFIGENTIIGGRITRGVCGIYANGTGNNLAIPSLKIYNVCLETPDMGIYLNNTEYCLIDNARYQEMGSNRIVLSINGDCRNTVFNGVAPMYSNSISCNITYPTSKRNPVLVNCPIAESGGGVIGKGAKLYSSGISIEPITSYRTKTLGNETYTISNNDFQYSSFTISNNSILNLNNSFGSHNIDSFIVTIAENKTLIIYDSNNTKIYDNTNSTSSSYTKFKFYCEDNNGTDKWIYVSFPYTSL